MGGASLDDVFVIVLFSAFTGMAQGTAAKIMDFVSIPVSIVPGILSGIIFGSAISFMFESAHKKGKSIRQTLKSIIVLGFAFRI